VGVQVVSSKLEGAGVGSDVQGKGKLDGASAQAE